MKLVCLLALSACSDPFADPADKDADTGDTGVDTDTDSGPPDDSDTEETGDSGPYDRDGDGFTEETDCDDDDPDTYPGAPEIWYDGFDSDCAGDNDYDQDGDGYLAEAIGGDDCVDTEATIHPDATELWYNGVDEDCAGGNDYDQDGDGDPLPAAGGLDCDDTDGTVNGLLMETLGDTVDSDCDGAVDGFWLNPLDTTGSAGLQGPRLAADSTSAMVSFLADIFTNPVSGDADVTGSFTYDLAEADPWSGLIGTSTWAWGADYSYSDGFDFVVSDDYYTWGHGLHYDGTRYLFGNVYDVATGDFGGTGLTYPTSVEFLDVELTEASDGSLHLVGCDLRLGFLFWLHGTPAEYLTNGSGLAGDNLANVEATTCVADVPERVILAGASTTAGVESFTYSDTSGLSSDDSFGEWAPYDMQSYLTGLASARVIAVGTDGVYVEVDGDAAILAAAAAHTVRGSLSATGAMALVYTNGSDAILAWGDVTTGFTEVVLETGLATADDADVYWSSGSQLLVVVRGGDEAVLGVVGI